MELNQLRFFKTVAELENFSEASNVLFVSQPALSKSIKNLEEELGINLFERIGKKVKLNDAGKAILPDVAQILSDIDTLEKKAQNLKEQKSISIYSPVLNFLLFIIPDLCINFEDLNIDYVYKHKETVFNLLWHNEADIIITNEPIINEKVNCTKLCDDYSVVELPDNHKLLKYKFIDAEKLSNMEIVSYKTDAHTPLFDKTKLYLQSNDTIKFKYHATMEGLSRYTAKVDSITINSTLSKYCGSNQNRNAILFNPKLKLTMGVYFCYKKDNENETSILQIKNYFVNYLKEYNENMKNGCL